MTNVKKIYQFADLLQTTKNQEASYSIEKKQNTINGNIADGDYDTTFYNNYTDARSYNLTFYSYDDEDLDFILRQLLEKNNRRYDVENLKKIFFISFDKLGKPRFFYNYGYTESVNLQYSEKSILSEKAVNCKIKTWKPFYYEIIKDLTLRTIKKEGSYGLVENLYNSNATYDTSYSYDVAGDVGYYEEISDNDLIQIFSEGCEKNILLDFQDYFNLTNEVVPPIKKTPLQRFNEKSLIIQPAGYTTNDTTYKVNDIITYPTTLGLPVGSKCGYLDLDTSKKTEVFVIQLRLVFGDPFEVTIKNEENQSFIKFKKIRNIGSPIYNGLCDLIIYTHLGRVFDLAWNELVPGIDFTIEVNNKYGSFFCDAFASKEDYNYTAPFSYLTQNSQRIKIDTDSNVVQAIIIESLKTFY